MRFVKALLAVAVTGLLGCSLVTGPPAGAEPADSNGAPAPFQQWIDDTVPAPTLTAPLWQQVLSTPTGDPIFDARPTDLDALRPGQIIEVRDVTATTAAIMPTPLRSATLVKFRSTSAEGTPTFGTATLIVPAGEWSGPGARPVEVNALPINSLGLHCTPGYQFSHGILDQPNTQLAVFMPSIWSALGKGHAVLVPDHEGPLMAYAEPNIAGHVMLDSVRAVRNQPSGEFTDSRFVAIGYSGGAIASYAAAMLLDEYAPELAGVLSGAAAGGLVTDYRDVAHRFNGNIASGIMLSVTLAIAREHPEMLPYTNHVAQWLATSGLRDICGDADGPLGAVGLPMEAAARIDHPLDSPIAETMYRLLDLTTRKSAVPLYIYHGLHDPWIPLEDAQRMYAQQCGKGVPGIFRIVPGEHLIGYVTGYPGLDAWLDGRLRDEAPPNECPPAPR
ncbi:lipase family protein [Nocardia sp. NPDC003482]